MLFINKLKDLLTLYDNWLPNPEDNVQLEQWIEAADILAYSFEFSEVEEVYINRIIEMYEEQFRAQIVKNINKTDRVSDLLTKEFLDDLINRKQTEQRTLEWYAQMTTIISASELGNLFGSPRQRAKLVMSKTELPQPRYQQLAVPSDTMSAFDWGIRFEPAVKQIYEYKYGTEIKELGRLHHAIDPRCTASPDGLVYSCPKNERTGRLIEIKCPVTREIDGSIPKDYYSQIQMQLHVTGCQQCDYIEAAFSAKYNNMALKEGPGLYNGYIGLIRYANIKGDQEFYYVYSPVNVLASWQPTIKEGEEIVEIIPWKLMEWSEQIVMRNDDWWESLKPIINKFWDDVERAKRGEFVVPESTRPAKKPREEKMVIVFTKLDESGIKITEDTVKNITVTEAVLVNTE